MDDTENLRILRDMAMGRDVSAGDRVMAANWAVREIVADAAIAADRAARAEPVAIHQFRNARCADWYDGVPDHEDGRGPYEERTLYTAPPAQPAPPAAPVVSEYDRNAYEELRSIIDGGSESMTHADAVEWCKRHADADWMQGKTAAPVVPVGWKLVPVEPTAAMREDIWAAMLAATHNTETTT